MEPCVLNLIPTVSNSQRSNFNAFTEFANNDSDCATHQDELSVTVKEHFDDHVSDTTEDHLGHKGQLWIVLIVILASIIGCAWIVILASIIYHETWSDVTLWDLVVCFYHVMTWGFVHIFHMVGQPFLLLFTFTIVLYFVFHFIGTCLPWLLFQWQADLNNHALQVPVQKVESATIQEIRKSKPGKLKRKLAVILGVDKDRKGNEADVERFRKLLPNLGYDDIICPPNPTRSDMIKALQEVQTREEETYEGLLVVIACHGSKGGILNGSDDKTISLKFLQWLVNGLLAPAFLHKPKLFIVNACRGTDEMEGIQTDSAGDLKFTNIGTDFYTARSNIEDHLSYRSADTGSYFLQAVADVWEKYYERESLHDVMIKVRQKLLKQYKGRQVVECTETITNKIVNGMYISN